MLNRPLAFVASILFLGCAASTPPAAPSAPEVAAPAPAPTSAPVLHTFTSDAAGFDTHSYWLDTGKEVVVFDAQFTPDAAKRVIAEIGEQTQSPIRYLIVTHPNPDKFNGAPAFQAVGAKVVASEATANAIAGVHAYKKYFFVNIAKMFSDATYPAQATVDLTFRGDLDLPLVGGASVKLHELKHRGVSSTQTVAYVPSSQALVVGDLVHYRAHAWFEGGIVDGKATPDLASWKEALGELLTYHGSTVYGGRGGAAPVEQAVKEERAYLERMESIVRDYVAGLGAAKAELNGPKAGEHHKKLAALAAQAFPDYALPYMVEYGVYGLVGQMAEGGK